MACYFGHLRKGAAFVPNAKSFVYIAEVNHLSTFGMESNVSALLDASLIRVPMEPEGSYLSISRFTDTPWQMACEAVSTNFSCSVDVERLKVFISKPTGVN